MHVNTNIFPVTMTYFLCIVTDNVSFKYKGTYGVVTFHDTIADNENNCDEIDQPGVTYNMDNYRVDNLT